MRVKIASFVFIFLISSSVIAQEQLSGDVTPLNSRGWVSLGMRSTVSAFSHDGSGVGTGGQFRVQLSERANTDWFADYISVSKNNIRSEYYHVGWSVLFYPFSNMAPPVSKFQPYILAGHCFDYNKKTVMDRTEISKGRWGSAVQTGLGVHYHVSPRFDISLTTQYMIHLTKEVEVEFDGDHYHIEKQNDRGLEGHLLTTISVNYKIFKLWNR